MAAKEEKKEVATVDQTSALPAFMGDMSDVAGLGNSQNPEDASLPFLGILQQLSPELNESKPEYMEGAKSGFLASKSIGKFWPSRIAKGEDGMLVVPCGFQRNFVVWKPQRGGYVETLPYDTDLLKRRGAKQSKVMVEGKERTMLMMDGNIVTDTMYTFVVDLEGNPYIIGAASTAQGPMRNWMSYRNTQKHPKSGLTLPAFAKVYRLRTAEQTKDNNTWHNWKVDDAGFVTSQMLYEAAKVFATKIAAGEVQIGRPDMFDSDPSSDEVPV